MSRQNPYSNALAGLWFTHEVTLQGEEIRTMRGVTYGPSQTVLASINMQSRTITTGIAGEETVVAGTLNWDIDGPLPAVGSKDRKSTRLNSSHTSKSRMPSSA